MTVSTCAVPKITGHAWRLPGATCDRGIEGQLYAPGPSQKGLIHTKFCARPTPFSSLKFCARPTPN